MRARCGRPDSRCVASQALVKFRSVHPLRALSEGESFRHIAVPYGSDEGFLLLTLPYVRQALSEGRRVLVVTTTANLDLLATALGKEAGLIDTRISTQWYLHPHRTLAAYLEYARGRRTLIVGEPVWTSRSARQIREWIRYESVANAAFGVDDCTVLCLYDLRDLPPAVLDHLGVVHPLRLTRDGERTNPDYIEPQALVLDGDLEPLPEPLPEPEGEAFTTTFTAGELKGLRQAVSDYARAAGMDRSLVASLVLSVSEIAANTVEHGAGRGTLTMWREAGELICEICDTGGGGWDNPLPGHIPPEPESARGYGLWISRQLCDLVELRSTRGTLWVRLHMGLEV